MKRIIVPRFTNHTYPLPNATCVMGALLKGLSVLMLPLLLPATASSQYTTTQIARVDMSNREPSIGDTGIVAWQAYQIYEGSGVVSDIHVYRNSKRSSLKVGHAEIMRADSSHSRPQVDGESVVWIANIGAAPRLTGALRDTPIKPNEPEELEARYEPNIIPGGRLSHYDKVGKSDSTSTNEVKDESLTGRRVPSGNDEICLWEPGKAVKQITSDTRNDIGISKSGSLMAWQKARGWPFGWEIMAYDGTTLLQLTTNHYYDMGPRVHGQQIAWYGWDGNDFEIFLYDHEKGTTSQITTNSYDDVSPVIWDGLIAWEGYPSVEADIYIHQDGVTRQLSNNLEDDFNPRVWDGKIVWQGFDGDDFEIYYHDGKETRKLTSNTYDDVKPDYRDGLVAWMAYHDTWDAEIFAWTEDNGTVRLTDNEYDDRDPRTAGNRIVWQADDATKSMIHLVQPKN